MNVLAFDLGGSRVKAGLFHNGRTLRRHSEQAPPDGAASTIESLVTRIASEITSDGESFDAAGLCVPGLVDEHGVVVSLPGKHAGIEGVDLNKILQSSLNVSSTVVVNDAIAYATGEAAFGSGRGFERVVVVTIGTGVGVTVIQEGQPITRGTVGGGILGGFIPISERRDGPLDSIGRSDTIEALCAAKRIAEACGNAPTVEAAYEAVARRDPRASAGIDIYRENLARALVALASAHAPGCIVLGGGPMVQGNPVTGPLSEMVNARMFGTYRVEIRTAMLGDLAALMGLSRLALAKGSA
ncbi:MAG: ROK family protein [Actinomycetota bacterium]